MNFIKKQGVLSRILGIILAVALVLTSIPLLHNAINVSGAAVNLVVNGDFEGISQLPSQFETVSGYEAKFNGYYSIQNTDIPDGFTGNNLKLAWDKNDFATFTFFTVRVPVESGVTYNVSYNIYTSDTTGGVKYRFSYGTEKWNGSNWGGYGAGRKDNITVMSLNGKVSQKITATSSEIWLLFGVKDSRATVDGDAVVYFDNISVIPAETAVQNGSFENALTDGWNDTTFADFSSVVAADEGITAVDGEKVLKIATVATWNYRRQDIPVKANTDYKFSFWVYRVGSGVSVYKLGIPSNETLYNPGGNQTYLNNEATGTWVKKTVVFNSGSNTSVRVTLCAHTGTTYIDNMTLAPVTEESIEDGGFEAGTLNGNWFHSAGSALSLVTNEKYEGNGAALIKPTAAWANTRYEIYLNSQTNYALKFMAKSSVSNTAIVKFNNPSGTNILEGAPANGNYAITAGNTWTEKVYYFNTGANNDFKLYLTGGSTNVATYIDNIKIARTYVVTATAEEGGTVTAPSGWVISGENATVTATADDIHTFDGWYKGGTKVSDAKSYTFTVEGDTELVAKFKAKNFELIKNGSFEDGFTSWNSSGSGISAIDATTDNLTAADGNKIFKADLSNGSKWANKNQTITITPNTDYLFSMWAYQPDANSKLILKIGTASNHTAFCPSGNEYQIWGKHKTYGQWFKITMPFNSGDNTELIMHLVLSGGVTYADNISLKKVVKVTATAEGGTVSGIPKTVVQGDQLTVTAVPDAGFAFSGWYKNGVRVSDTASYTFYAAADTTLQARFESTNNLIADGSFEGTELNSNWNNSFNRGSITNTEKYDGAQSLFIEKQGGYANLYYWPINVEKNTNYRIEMKVKIPADASIPLIKVLDNGGSGNSLLNQADAGGNTWLNARNNNIVAGCDWQDAYFTFNSGDNTQVSMLFTGNSSAAAYIDDITVIKYYKISVTAQGAGTVTGLSQDWAYADAPISLKAEANSGSGFDGWYENDVKISSDLVLQFNAAADRVIVAKFEELDNYILDSGFELESLHSNWVNPWDRLSVTDEEAYEGEQSLHLSKTELTNYPFGQYPITVKPNTNYMIKMMVKIPTGSGIPLLQVLGAGNAHLLNERDMSNNNFFINGGDQNAAGKGWFPVTATFNSGDNTSVKIALTGNSKAEAYIDNLIVGEAYTATITAGENGSVSKTTVLGLKNAVTTITAIPDKDYMVEGWYINGVKVSEEKNYNHLFTSDVALEVRFTVSDLPVMTDFDLEKLWCAEGDNMLSDSSFELGTGVWNTASFIKDGVLDVVEFEGQKVLYFNPDGKGRQVMYFPVVLEGNTEYMFSAKVRGKYYSDTNHMDMSFGIMNDDGEYIILENYASGGYYNEKPNVTTTKSITPPSWDNNWHRRGITFKTIAPTTVWIAVSGNLSEAYLDDFMLCKANKAVAMPVEENIAKRTNINVEEDKIGCADSDNLVENYSFNDGEAGWDDGYGWQGLYSGVYVAETGEENKSLLMRSTTGHADYHYYIQWIDVKPDTEYTFSLAAATTSFESSYGLLVEGAKRYDKLMTWSADNNSEWVYNAFSFNSNDSTRVGIFVMDGGRATALDDIRLFETSKATALEDKLTGEADIPEELIILPEDEEDTDSNEGEENLPENEESLDGEDKEETSDNQEDGDSSENDKEDETPNKKVKKKKKVVKIINNNADGDYTLWWILGGVGVALLLAGTILLIIILIKKKRKKAAE